MPFGRGTKQGLRLTTLGALALLGGYYYYSGKQKGKSTETEDRQDYARYAAEIFKIARKLYGYVKNFNANA